MDNRPRAQTPFIPSLRAIFRPGVGSVPSSITTPLQPSQPNALASPEMPIALPGSFAAPAGAIPVDSTGDIDLAAGASGIVLSIQVPDSLRFRVQAIGFGADDETALRFLTWSLRRSGVDPFPTYFAQPSAVGSIRQLSPMFLMVDSSVTFTVFAASDASAVVTYHYIARVIGYFYQELSA